MVEIWGTKITLLGGRRNSKEDAGVMGFKDGTPGLAQFQYPRGLALGQGGVLLVADRGNGALRKIGPGGVTTEKTGFGGPEDVVADLTSGRVFIADGSSARIRVLEKSGTLSTLAGTGSVGTTDGPGSTAQFKDPAGLALDKNGYLYLAERGNSRIRVINPN